MYPIKWTRKRRGHPPKAGRDTDSKAKRWTAIVYWKKREGYRWSPNTSAEALAYMRWRCWRKTLIRMRWEHVRLHLRQNLSESFGHGTKPESTYQPSLGAWAMIRRFGNRAYVQPGVKLEKMRGRGAWIYKRLYKSRQKPWESGEEARSRHPVPCSTNWLISASVAASKALTKWVLPLPCFWRLSFAWQTIIRCKARSHLTLLIFLSVFLFVLDIGYTLICINTMPSNTVYFLRIAFSSPVKQGYRSLRGDRDLKIDNKLRKRDRG